MWSFHSQPKQQNRIKQSKTNLMNLGTVVFLDFVFLSKPCLKRCPCPDLQILLAALFQLEQHKVDEKLHEDCIQCHPEDLIPWCSCSKCRFAALLFGASGYSNHQAISRACRSFRKELLKISRLDSGVHYSLNFNQIL